MSIMRERLSINLKQLPAQAAAWSGGGGQHRPLDDPGDQPPPSAFAATCAKQLTILSGALAPLLLPAELHGILGRIALMFSRTLSEAYELLEPHGPAWEQQLRADVQVLCVSASIAAGFPCCWRCQSERLCLCVPVCVHVCLLCRVVCVLCVRLRECIWHCQSKSFLLVADVKVAAAVPTMLSPSPRPSCATSSCSTACATYPKTRGSETPTWSA